MESFSLYPKEIFIVIVDENGDEMLSDFTYSDFHMIPAGKRAPFKISLYPWNEVPEDADGAIFDLEVKDEGYSTYSWDLEVVDSEGKLKPQNYGGYEYEIEADIPYDYPGIDHFEFYLEGSIISE